MPMGLEPSGSPAAYNPYAIKSKYPAPELCIKRVKQSRKFIQIQKEQEKKDKKKRIK